jgi:hypothetical protein
MTLRVDLKERKAYSMDNVVFKPNDIISFNDVADLDPPVPERIALLRLAEEGEVVPDIGMRIDSTTYIVQEL